MEQEQDWRERDDRACRGRPFEEFFPVGRSDSAGYIATERAALAVCARCPVVSDCLAWAIGHGITDGVWGGMGEGERRKLVSAAKRKAREAERARGKGAGDAHREKPGGGEVVAGVGAQAPPQ